MQQLRQIIVRQISRLRRESRGLLVLLLSQFGKVQLEKVQLDLSLLVTTRNYEKLAIRTFKYFQEL